MVSAIGQGAVAAIGNFDGVHRGHLALIDAARALAAECGAPSAALVFDPHPRRYFRPEDPPFLLTRSDDRDRLLKEAGLDAALRLPFDASLASMSPEAFVTEILVKRFALAGVATGADFRFGAGRAGDAQILSRLCAEAGLACRAVAPLHDDGAAAKIGSSGVRALIAVGDMADAARALGRPWHVSGLVECGRQLGRTIDFPTANVDLGPLIRPRHGVYAVKVHHGGETHDGVANFGRRPTVDNGAPRLEAHLFDFAGDLYGEEIGVDFYGFIRGEMKFDGLDALREQILRDCETARGLLAGL